MNNKREEYLFHQGTNYRAYNYLGVNKTSSGYCFRVWSPNADRVYLCGDFNKWSEGYEMQRITDNGIYEYIDREGLIQEGDKYKYKIYNGERSCLKADPYARFSECPPRTASVVYTRNDYKWSDGGWLEYRRNIRENVFSLPLNVYEVHLGSFKRNTDGSVLSYIEYAHLLASYVKGMGYTHIELMPIMEHPFEDSWGYQVSAYFSPDARYGTPDEFKSFIDIMHNAGVGVILDWVPAHFPKDAHGLYEFDGRPLYEYQGKDRIEHEIWGTRRFDVGRNEVQSFLISNALYWLTEFHADGLRVDAVASMLYLDYDRRDGEWIPNVYGDNKCLEAIAFFKKLNRVIKEQEPSAIMIAEESTAWSNITGFDNDGLGFDFKWNMGWMNDSLSYIARDPIYRKYHHDEITFSLTYAFSESFMLPISHDEVVHGKRSMLNKCFGDYWQKFATSRLYMAYMMTHPGKKLTFMGCELGAFREWDHKGELEWFLLDYEMHAKYQLYISRLNALYLSEPPLWEEDSSWEGFKWIDVSDAQRSIFSYKRTDKQGNELIVILNFTPVVREGYTVEANKNSIYTEVFNSDDERYGGSNVKNNGEIKADEQISGDFTIKITLPPLAAIILKEIDENE